MREQSDIKYQATAPVPTTPPPHSLFQNPQSAHHTQRKILQGHFENGDCGVRRDRRLKFVSSTSSFHIQATILFLSPSILFHITSTRLPQCHIRAGNPSLLIPYLNVSVYGIPQIEPLENSCLLKPLSHQASHKTLPFLSSFTSSQYHNITHTRAKFPCRAVGRCE
jgi:hypothetical protein